MNNKVDVAVLWTKGRLEGHSNTVWFFLGIVITVAMQQVDEVLVWWVPQPFWLSALIAAAVTVTVFVEGYKFLCRRYGGKS